MASQDHLESSREILRRARAATVAFVVVPDQTIQASPADRKLPQIVGTGFALEEDPRIIVTAAHVVAGAIGNAAEASVGSGSHRPGILWETDFQAATLTATYGVGVGFEVKTQRNLDVGAVRLSQNADPPPAGLPLGDATEVHEGDRVVTCGWPYGTQVHGSEPVVPSFASGTISNIKPHPRVAPENRSHYWVQMPVNPGNSGGAVFNPTTGEVIGIVVSMIEIRGVRAGLAHVVPIALARPGIDNYIQSG